MFSDSQISRLCIPQAHEQFGRGFLCMWVCLFMIPSQSSRKSILNNLWKAWCWSWSSNTLATWCKELTHWKRPWCWKRLKAGGEGDDRGWDGWMASPTRWTWVWASSGSWWWTGKPGVLRFMGLKELDMTEPLNNNQPWSQKLECHWRFLPLLYLFLMFTLDPISDPFLTLLLSRLSAPFLPNLASCLDVLGVLLTAFSNSLTPTPLPAEGLSTSLDDTGLCASQHIHWWSVWDTLSVLALACSVQRMNSVL